ncbi:hypothetical protein [Halosimplex salinum]|uniref:hypothetical protein n=1 Tax=Halosimplex salinum TaxID=1710538 RepID=UPI000F48AC95|nr:hypothetical protein [Halosimplex salinum]
MGTDRDTDAAPDGVALTDGGEPTTVVLGDSVAWGQGLPHEEKFATRFHERISGGNGELSRAAFKAHSGAVFDTDRDDVTLRLADAGKLAGTTRRGRHEFPAGAFSLEDQLERLPADYTDEERPSSLETRRAYDPDDTVDVVVVTAGINDIGGGTIGNPLQNPDRTETAVREYCYQWTKPFLEDVRESFPEATVVVTGYHLIMSTGPEGTDVLSDAAMAAGLGVVFGVSAGTAAVTGALYGTAEVAQQRAAANMEYFYQQSTHYLRKAVSEANAAEPGSTVLFASPNFDRENAANADDPWVWPAGSTGDDAVESDRKAVCEAMRGPPIHDGTMKCPIAATFHPNADGAAAIARAMSERHAESTGSRSLRETTEKLAADESGPTSVRDAMERYAGVDDLLDPSAGLRTCLDQTVVDSVRVVVETSDATDAGNQNASVVLDLGDLERTLDDTFGQRLFNHANFGTGEIDTFAIDPLLDTDRTERDPLRLWEIDRTVLEQDQGDFAGFFNSQWWKIESFELFLNGVRVVESASFSLDGDDSQSFDYPAS